MRIGVAGSLNSSDTLITVYDYQDIKIDIESTVFDYFGEQIRQVIEETLKEMQVKGIFVKCIDKGALDFTIKSRLITAIKRMNAHA